MNELDLIKENIETACQSFKCFEKAYNESTLKYITSWRNCSFKMGELIEEQLGFPCYINIRKDRTHALYELTYDGAANVPQEHYSESEIEITVNLSPELYTHQLYIPEEQWERYKEQFVLTFVHELTHSLQFDDSKDGQAFNFDSDYFSSPFEIDAYSSELAFDMFLYKKKEKACDAYARYATIDTKVADKMRTLAKEKYQYLKNTK
tara:strand:+ start:563 stop:1183 length:621 start_codon:yes stop_codon:yes gene_type:complete